MDTFKKRLEYYMRCKGFNPTSLARHALLNMTAIRDILEHEATPNPRIDTFVKLCRALGVSPDQLSPDFEKLYTTDQLQMLAIVWALERKDAELAKEGSEQKSDSLGEGENQPV